MDQISKVRAQKGGVKALGASGEQDWQVLGEGNGLVPLPRPKADKIAARSAKGLPRLFEDVLPKRLSHCALKGEAFKPGMKYATLLSPQGQRQDFCLSCWKNVQRKASSLFWLGSIPEKPPAQRGSDAEAMALFETVLTPKERFVLALYLQRQKQLVRRTRTLFEVPENGKIWEVTPIPLSEGEARLITEAIEEKLGQLSV